MRKIRNYIVAFIIMLLISVFTLIVVSTLTYLLKWQADKAMIGIIITYILAGGTGGFVLGRLEKNTYARDKGKEIGKQIVEAMILSTIFMVLLIVCTCAGFQIPFKISYRFMQIWLLVTASTFGGRHLYKRFVVK